MVLEQVLTIIFAVGVGAAIIVYAARPRHNGASISAGPSAIGSFAPAEIAQAVPMPQVAAIETPIVETYPEVLVQPEVAPVVADVAAGPIEVAPGAAPMASLAPIAETVESPASVAVVTHKAQRKRSTATKTRARSTRRTKKS